MSQYTNSNSLVLFYHSLILLLSHIVLWWISSTFFMSVLISSMTGSVSLSMYFWFVTDYSTIEFKVSRLSLIFSSLMVDCSNMVANVFCFYMICLMPRSTIEPPPSVVSGVSHKIYLLSL